MKQQLVIPRSTNHFKKGIFLTAFLFATASSVQATPPDSPPTNAIQQKNPKEEPGESAQSATTRSNQIVEGRIVSHGREFFFQTLPSNGKSQPSAPSKPLNDLLPLSQVSRIDFPVKSESSPGGNPLPVDRTLETPSDLCRLRLVGRQVVFAQTSRLDQKAISVSVFGQPPVRVPLSAIVTLEFPSPPKILQQKATTELETKSLSKFPQRGPRSQDVLVYRNGGELYGRFVSGNSKQINFSSALGAKSVDRDQVAALYFAAREIPPRSAEGLYIGVRLRPPAHEGPLKSIPARPVQEYLEGQLANLSETNLTLHNELLGTLAIPLDRVEQLKILHDGPRITMDPHSRRLGNAEQGVLGAGGAEGTRLAIPFSLKGIPLAERQGMKAYLVVSVFEMESQKPGQRYTKQLTDGHLRTSFSINGQDVDYLNRHIRPPASARQRLRVSIPVELLKADQNQLEFVQTPSATNAKEFDDCELWSVGIEFEIQR